MDESILESIKGYLGINPDDIVFDGEIIIAINSAFMTLSQLGVGSEDTFTIHDSTTTWSEFVEDVDQLPMIKSYIFIRARLMVDPPTSSQLMTALQDTAREYEWRLNAAVDIP